MNALTHLIQQPRFADTARSDDGRVWTPSSATNFLAELEGIAEQAQTSNIFYRGQEDFDWLLDSTIARTIKCKLFGFKPGEFPDKRTAASHWFVQTLYGAFHFKYGDGMWPSKQLVEQEKIHPEIDPWFELMKWHQQYPGKDHPVLKGSHLLDWSVAPGVASWFAARKGDNDAAVYVWNVSQSGACSADWKMRAFLNRMMEHDWQLGPINGRPLIFCPKRQMLMARANAQAARYVAQQDLRWPLETAWQSMERELGIQLYLKVRLPYTMKAEVIRLLADRGIDRPRLFPDIQEGEVV